MKKFLYLILCLTILFTPGCWSKNEINELAFVMAIGIDQAADNDYLVSFQIALPSAKGGGEGNNNKIENINLSFKTANIREACNQINKTLDRAVFIGQTRLVVYSEAVAREGLIPLLDCLGRFYRLRRNVNILVVKGEASDLFQTSPSGNSVLALNLGERIGAINKMGLNEEITVGNFLTKLATGKIQPVIPGVQILAAQGKEIQFPAKQEELAVQELAVFQGDRMVGWLNKEETQGYMYTTGKAQQASVKVPYNSDQSFQLQLTKPKISKEVEIEADRPVIKLKFKADAEVAEAAAYLDITPERWSEITKDVAAKANQVVQNEIVSAVKTAQGTYHSDIFGFGQLIYRDKPELWQQIEAKWQQEVFPQVKVEVEADITIKRSGITNNPPYLPKEERHLPIIE